MKELDIFPEKWKIKRNIRYANKQAIGVSLAFFLLIISLGGCTESYQNTNEDIVIIVIIDEKLITGDTDKVGIINYTVTTVCYNLNDSTNYNKSGFYHTSSKNTSLERYVIKGTAKNIAGELLDIVTIYTHFYDKSGVFLNFTAGNWAWDIENKETWNFDIIYDKNDYNFLYADDVKFKISVS